MRVLFTIFLIFIVSPVCAQVVESKDMTIEEAYRAIPHKQTPFSLKQSRLPKDDAKYLDHYFFASDIAMKARVMALNGFYGRYPNMGLKQYNREINDVISSFEFAQPPPHLKQAQDLLISAIRDQQVFFNDWGKAHGTAKYEALKRNYTAHPKVQSAHGKLIQAYYMIKAQYPREVQHNITAFFDHLCALDFI